MSLVRRRMTKQRTVIYDILCADHTHPTAEVIYGKTQEVLPNISLGTVYRNLNLLAEDGMIKKLDLGDDKVNFDGDITPHSHFICESCGKIIDINVDTNDLKQLENDLATKNKLIVHSAELVFRGICDECVCKS